MSQSKNVSQNKNHLPLCVKSVLALFFKLFRLFILFSFYEENEGYGLLLIFIVRESFPLLDENYFFYERSDVRFVIELDFSIFLWMLILMVFYFVDVSCSL